MQYDGSQAEAVLMSDVAGYINELIASRIWTNSEMWSSSNTPPPEPGVYGWWFRDLPASVPVDASMERDGMRLLYIGISPKAPPKNGAKPSSQSLRKRIRYHYRGNAYGSTLRLSLGCLLADELGISLQVVGSGKRMTFADGEGRLSDWMHQNACVSWLVHSEPWMIEHAAIQHVSLPINLDGNKEHPFHSTLSASRRDAKRAARRAWEEAQSSSSN